MNILNVEPKKIYFSAYENLSQLEKAVKLIEERRPIDFKITVMGTVFKICAEQNNGDLKNHYLLQEYWNILLRNHPKLGVFYNPELGSTFIVGTLASAFMNEINGKILGSLLVGPYAIIRGMGATEAQALELINALKAQKYLILFRGERNDLEKYKIILEDIEQ
ncbi:hypothetical protein [Flavobacterium sp. PL12]|uniref:hypothetical protein n=1 Tax=Flavobacterium sp. PL12 TaxID=3071718 RepID=UPI00319DC5FC